MQRLPRKYRSIVLGHHLPRLKWMRCTQHYRCAHKISGHSGITIVVEIRGRFEQSHRNVNWFRTNKLMVLHRARLVYLVCIELQNLQYTEQDFSDFEFG